MFLLKLGSELQKLVKKFLSAMKIQRKYKPNFFQAEYFHEVECTYVLTKRNPADISTRKAKLDKN